MKLTIEPTRQTRSIPLSATNPTVTISYEDDYMDFPDMVEHVIAPALVAWGYTEETVRGGLFGEFPSGKSDSFTPILDQEERQALACKLRQYNAWRRGDIDDLPFDDPKEITVLLKQAISFLIGGDDEFWETEN